MSTYVEKFITPYILNINQKILEIGCGNGKHLIGLCEEYRNFLVGAEYSYDFFAKNINLGINFISCDAVSLPFKNNSIHIIYSNSFFEHVYDTNKALREQFRVLKPSGYIIILVSNLLNPKSFYHFFFKYAIRSMFKRGGLKWLFKKEKVENNIYSEQYDFKIIKQRDEDVHSLFWWKKFLEKSLPRSFKIIKLTTSRADELPYYLRCLLRVFWGGIVIVIKKF